MYMKYLTLDLWLKSQNPATTDLSAYERWGRYFADIRTRLPESIVALEETALHDARLRELNVDMSRRRAALSIDAAHSEGGLQRLRLTFKGLVSIEFASDPERGLSGPHGFGDLGYWETDVWEDAYEFRVLFSSGIEMRMRFEGVEIENVGTEDHG